MDRALFRNIASLATIQGANYLLPLMTVPYLARVLGPEAFGQLGFSIAFIQYFVIVTEYGFNLSATQAIARHQDDAPAISRIFWTVMTCKLLLLLGAFALLVVLIALVPQLAEISAVLLSAYLTAVGNLLFPVWLFQGIERMGNIALCNLLARAALLPLIFLLVQSTSDVWLAALVQTGSGVLAGLISIALIRRQGIIRWMPPNRADIREAFADGWHIFLSTATVSLYTNSNTVLLGFLAGAQATGQFVGVDKLRQAAQGLTGPISQAVYPRVNALMSRDRQAAFRFIRKVLAIQGIGTFVLSAVLFVGAEPLVRLLLGVQYLPAVPTLRWLAFMPFVIGLSNVFAIQTMLPLGMKRAASRIWMASAAVHLMLAVPLALFHADRGVAAAMMITETVVTGLMGTVLLMRQIPIFWKASPPGGQLIQDPKPETAEGPAE